MSPSPADRMPTLNGIHASPGAGARAAPPSSQHARWTWLTWLDANATMAARLCKCSGPALVVVRLWAADADSDMVTRVSVFSAAMPPMIGAAVVALQANLAPRFVSMMVGPGIPFGLVTAPVWLWLFDRLARA